MQFLHHGMDQVLPEDLEVRCTCNIHHMGGRYGQKERRVETMRGECYSKHRVVLLSLPPVLRVLWFLHSFRVWFVFHRNRHSNSISSV